MGFVEILIMASQLILGLSILVGVHELGHMLAAKKFGMRVEKFSIGFPPKIASVKKGETEYSIGAIPLGGFVKISGMVDESMDTAMFRSDALKDMNENCDYGSVGNIRRIEGTPSNPDVEELIPNFYENIPTKQFNGFFFAFLSPQDSCIGGIQGEPEAFALETKAFDALENGFENIVLID